jgi:hypothetical protein
MQTLHSFIISWEGKHARAIEIASAIKSQTDNLTIVWSDSDPNLQLRTEVPNIRRPNDQYFADKFSTCIENCSSDLVLIIHADCSCESWPRLVQRCRAAFAKYSKLNAWAPKIDNTFFYLDRTEILSLPESDLSIVAQTDAIVLAFRSATIPRLLEAQLRNFTFGWGICWMIICHTYSNGFFAAVDRDVSVHHDVSRGYSKPDASRQRDQFFKTFNTHEESILIAFNNHLREKNRVLKEKSKIRKKAKQIFRHFFLRNNLKN